MWSARGARARRGWSVRGEHASLRALANAARLLRGNPELMNLRLLQAVNAGQKSATLVLGGTALAPVSPAGMP